MLKCREAVQFTRFKLGANFCQASVYGEDDVVHRFNAPVDLTDIHNGWDSIPLSGEWHCRCGTVNRLNRPLRFRKASGVCHFSWNCQQPIAVVEMETSALARLRGRGRRHNMEWHGRHASHPIEQPISAFVVRLLPLPLSAACIRPRRLQRILNAKSFCLRFLAYFRAVSFCTTWKGLRCRAIPSGFAVIHSITDKIGLSAGDLDATKRSSVLGTSGADTCSVAFSDSS